MKPRWVLMNPGPVNVTPGVRSALLGPDICHREDEFSELFADTRRRLLRIFHIEKTHAAALFTGSGTLAVESMLSSYARPGKKVLVLSNGVYGERLAQILNVHDAAHRVLAAPLGSFPSLEAVEEVLKKDKNLTAIAMVHHETSTGMLNPLEAVGMLAKKYKKTLLVDAVSSLGAETVDFAKYGIDFCAGSAGKCLHGYPGVAFVLVSKKEAAKLSGGATVYMDLAATLKAGDSGAPAFTPAVQLFYAFRQALAELEKEGLGRRIAHYARKSEVLEKGLMKIGVRLLLEKKHRSHALLAAKLPETVTYEHLHARLKQNGFVIYAGQSALRNSIFRVSTLGDIREHDVKRFLIELEKITGGKLQKTPKAIVLAAGVGKRFGARTRRLPKCLIPLSKSGETLLARYFDAFRNNGIADVAVVVGHQKHLIAQACKKYGAGLNIKLIENKHYRKGSVLSLHTAGKYLNDDVIVMDADVFFPVPMLGRLLDAPGSAFLLDEGAKENGEEMMLRVKNGRPLAITKPSVPGLKPIGEATGIVKFSKNDAKELQNILKNFVRQKNVLVEYEDAYCKLLEKRKISWVPTQGYFWTEMDFEEDLKKITDFLKN